MGIVVADAGDAGHRPLAHHAAEYLGIKAGNPGRNDHGVSPLPIGGDHLGTLADAGHFAAVDAPHVHKTADVGIHFTDGGVPGVPNFEQAILAPALEFGPAALA